MKAFARLMLFTMAVGAVAACGKDKPTQPRGTNPTREALNGNYTCSQMFAFYPGPQGTDWYGGTCTAYRNAFPQRRDSIETVSFTVQADGRVTRPEFGEGFLSYDTATAEAVVNYSYKNPDDFIAQFNGSALELRQRFTPFDLSGDGQPDSLILVFRKTSR